MMDFKGSQFEREIILWDVRVEQDHRAVKRLTHPMLGFKSFWAAFCTIAGIEVMHAIHKGQLATPENARQTPAE